MNHRSHQITRNFGNGVSIERGAANPLAYSRGRDSRRIFRKPDYTVERTNAFRLQRGNYYVGSACTTGNAVELFRFSIVKRIDRRCCWKCSLPSIIFSKRDSNVFLPLSVSSFLLWETDRHPWICVNTCSRVWYLLIFEPNFFVHFPVRNGKMLRY